MRLLSLRKVKMRIIKFLLGICFVSISIVLTNAQYLQEYINIAKENSPRLKIDQIDYSIGIEKINEVGNFDETKFSLGAFVLTPETRVGPQWVKLGAEQSLPWFGINETKKNLQKEKTELKQFDLLLSEKRLDYKVKELYYEIFYNQAIQEILKENKEVLNTFEDMSLVALSTNHVSMSDVLDIRIKKNELHSKIFQTINETEALKKNFNRLLGIKKDTVLIFPDNLDILDLFIGNGTIENHPLIQIDKQFKKIYRIEDELNVLENKPKLSVGIDYIIVGKRDNIDLAYNGKDILMPKFGISLPLFNKTVESKKRQIELKQKKLSYEIEEKELKLRQELELAKIEFDNAIVQVVSAQKNKVETQRAIDVDLKAYETGTLNYTKIVRLQLQKLKYQLMEIEAIKKAFIAKSKIDFLVT